MSSEIPFRPWGDVLVVQLDPTPPAVSRGGLILPDSSQHNKILTGRVVRHGPGRIENGKRLAVDVEVGSRVAFFSANFATSAGQQLSRVFQGVLGDDYALVYARDVLFELASPDTTVEVK